MGQIFSATVKLSILIATITSRQKQFDKLIAHLEMQSTDEVEILVSRDDGYPKSRITRGAKRQALLKAAQGEFIVYRDDDDQVPDDYIPRILERCKPAVDCIGYKFACYGYANNRRQMEPACVSRRYSQWATAVDGFRYVRSPHHLVPVRRAHALKVGFDPALNHGEDYKYSMGLVKSRLLKNEEFIDDFMYIIRHDRDKRPGE